MNDIIALFEKTYDENRDFKKIIDKIPLIESIYKGLNVSDIPQIIKLIKDIKIKQPDKKIKFGNITYDYEDFINIDISKIVETENFKLIGFSYKDEKLVRKLNLHNKNPIECLKIIKNSDCNELINTLIFVCMSVYLIIDYKPVINNISVNVLNMLTPYKQLVQNILDEYKFLLEIYGK